MKDPENFIEYPRKKTNKHRKYLSGCKTYFRLEANQRINLKP